MNTENQTVCGTNTCNCGPNCDCRKSQCCWCKVSLAFGLTNGLWIFILGLLGAYAGHGLNIINALSNFYPGFAPTLKGSFIGAAWAFGHMFIFFLVVGFIYKILKTVCHRCCRARCATTSVCSK